MSNIVDEVTCIAESGTLRLEGSKYITKPHYTLRVDDKSGDTAVEIRLATDFFIDYNYTAGGVNQFRLGVFDLLDLLHDASLEMVWEEPMTSLRLRYPDLSQEFHLAVSKIHTANRSPVIIKNQVDFPLGDFVDLMTMTRQTTDNLGHRTTDFHLTENLLVIAQKLYWHGRMPCGEFYQRVRLTPDNNPVIESDAHFRFSIWQILDLLAQVSFTDTVTVRFDSSSPPMVFEFPLGSSSAVKLEVGLSQDLDHPPALEDWVKSDAAGSDEVRFVIGMESLPTFQRIIGALARYAAPPELEPTWTADFQFAFSLEGWEIVARTVVGYYQLQIRKDFFQSFTFFKTPSPSSTFEYFKMDNIALQALDEILQSARIDNPIEVIILRKSEYEGRFSLKIPGRIDRIYAIAASIGAYDYSFSIASIVSMDFNSHVKCSRRDLLSITKIPNYNSPYHSLIYITGEMIIIQFEGLYPEDPYDNHYLKVMIEPRHEPQVKLKCRSKYLTRHLLRVLRLLEFFETVEIGLSTDRPLKIEYPFHAGFLRFFIAPVVLERDYEDGEEMTEVDDDIDEVINRLLKEGTLIDP